MTKKIANLFYLCLDWNLYTIFYAQVYHQYDYFSYFKKWDNAINNIAKHQNRDLPVLFQRELADFVEPHIGKEFNNLGPA